MRCGDAVHLDDTTAGIKYQVPMNFNIPSIPGMGGGPPAPTPFPTHWGGPGIDESEISVLPSWWPFAVLIAACLFLGMYVRSHPEIIETMLKKLQGGENTYGAVAGDGDSSGDEEDGSPKKGGASGPQHDDLVSNLRESRASVETLTPHERARAISHRYRELRNDGMGPGEAMAQAEAEAPKAKLSASSMERGSSRSQSRGGSDARAAAEPQSEPAPGAAPSGISTPKDEVKKSRFPTFMLRPKKGAKAPTPPAEPPAAWNKGGSTMEEAEPIAEPLAVVRGEAVEGVAEEEEKAPPGTAPAVEPEVHGTLLRHATTPCATTPRATTHHAAMPTVRRRLTSPVAWRCFLLLLLLLPAPHATATAAAAARGGRGRCWSGWWRRRRS